ncbi:5-formyltetrahydrofolate cyclo-ligase [Candidatus Nitrotoga sp. HW29]|uniref:5-formyltetrahydrofolate cyclo-ligase n=1 Tax=Candidatus Nitrotoga sp. HW29 TaxID=2886963 RepID=UPI001EF28159|nr:5-formyltetrahydrofolate cyclo-ligase [Candidatus Nitrotoga sp. HW29]CAH1906449.1 5-formyltetrahydrofolate cyclo-ligase [Candidatus Nitrotoga sp. HW29]
MTIQVMKQAIRQRIITDREQLTAAERACLSHAISERIAHLDTYRTANTVLAYMSFGAEFSTDKWVQQALRNDKCVLLPKVNRTTKELDIYHVTNLQHDLAPGQWGIREPLAERCAKMDALQKVDFILLPGVAFGRNGARLGYGGGFYDKLLARIKASNQNCRPALIAGAFAIQLVEDIPQETTDHKVEWVVTENETIQCISNMHIGR